MFNVELQTDELKEAIKGLEMVERLLPDLMEDPHLWNWVIIALHVSLQGFMVAALKGSSGLDVLREDSAKKWLEAHRAGARVFPKEILDSFPNLYRKIKSDRMLKYKEVSRKFVATERQDVSVRVLHALRNDFIHFRPSLLYMNIQKLPQVAKDCLSVIRFLALESGNVWYRKGYSAHTIEASIKRVNGAIDELASHYSSDAKE